MSNVFRAAAVIARRDFVATVWSRSYLIFLLAPLAIMAFSLLAGLSAGRAERDATRPVVAVAADSATVQFLQQARDRLAAGTSERIFPELRPVPLVENLDVYARQLLANETEGFSAVFTGTIERPVLTGPSAIEETVARRIALLVEEARRTDALDRAGIVPPPTELQRVVTERAAGNLKASRSGLAQGSQMLIFMVTLMLATLLLSNMVEEKSNKVIEVLAAAVPLDAVFLGKLVAMLGASVVGLLVWGGMLGLGYAFVQTLQQWMMVPEVTPAVGWPLFLLLLLFYYAANYMLLGALFLGIGGQASNIREIQSLSMPVTFLQLMVLILALNAIGGERDALAWAALLLPFSSPLAMVAMAAESPVVWPHLLALLWQAVWVVLIIRLSASLFRKTVLKSGARRGFWQELRAWRG